VYPPPPPGNGNWWEVGWAGRVLFNPLRVVLSPSGPPCPCGVYLINFREGSNSNCNLAPGAGGANAGRRGRLPDHLIPPMGIAQNDCFQTTNKLLKIKNSLNNYCTYCETVTSTKKLLFQSDSPSSTPVREIGSANPS
jgi:hypothetical protein